MKKNIFSVKDGFQTAWYSSEIVGDVAKATELLSRANDCEPSISAFEQCAGNKLRPITQGEYDEAIRAFADGSCRGLVAEIDLAGDQGRLSYVGSNALSVHRFSGAISRFAGCYELATNKRAGTLDTDALVNSLIQHCAWERISSPQECFGTQVPFRQGMSMV